MKSSNDMNDTKQRQQEVYHARLDKILEKLGGYKQVCDIEVYIGYDDDGFYLEDYYSNAYTISLETVESILKDLGVIE